MSDEIAKAFESQKTSDAPPTGRSISLTITLHPNGQIDYSIPTNKVLAWGLLGAAQEQLTKLAVMSDVAKSTSARGGLNGLMKRMNGG